MQPSKEDILQMYRAARIKASEDTAHLESDKWKEGKVLLSHKWRHCPGSMKVGDKVLYQMYENAIGMVTILHISRKELPIPTVIDQNYIQLSEG